jgi:hypothetical protein
MKIKILGLSFLLTGCLSLFNSCIDDEYNRENNKPEHSGELGEVLLVIDKPYWDGALVKTIKDSLEKLNYSLPQPEPFMNVKLVSSKHFTASSNTHHTVLYIDLITNSNDFNAKLDGPKSDVWAKNQVLYKIYAKTEAEALAVFVENFYVLQYAFENRIREMALAKVSESTNDAINEELGLTLKLNAHIPKGFTVAGNFGDMVWLSQLRMRYADGNDHEVQLGLMLYTYPYFDSTTFSQEWQLNKRDSITKKYIKGDLEGSYMLTERSEGLASKEFMFNDQYIFETRGLWRMQNALMGGPFMSISFYDEPNKRIVTLDGFVYAPYFRKMEYLREIEAILYSYKLLE